MIPTRMLTEGVDLPDTLTAFLGPPTTSRVLLQQMIGRVLRRPRAGEAKAKSSTSAMSGRTSATSRTARASAACVRSSLLRASRRRRAGACSSSTPSGARSGSGGQHRATVEQPAWRADDLVPVGGLLPARRPTKVPVVNHQLAAIQKLLTDAMDGSSGTADAALLRRRSISCNSCSRRGKIAISNASVTRSAVIVDAVHQPTIAWRARR